MASTPRCVEWTEEMTIALLDVWECFLAERHTGNLRTYDYKSITDELNERLGYEPGTISELAQETIKNKIHNMTKKYK